MISLIMGVVIFASFIIAYMMSKELIFGLMSAGFISLVIGLAFLSVVWMAFVGIFFFVLVFGMYFFANTVSD